VTAARVANVVTYTFVDCTGPFGLVHVNGKIVATISKGASAGTMDVAVKSDGLTLNKTPIEQSATAHVTFAGTTRTVKWDGQYDGTTPGGRKLAHTSSYTSSFASASERVER